MRFSPSKAFVALSATVLALSATTAHGQVTNAPFGLFPVGPANVLFDGFAGNAEMNGATANGVQISYSLGNGHIINNGGPGVTNNVSQPNLVSIGNPAGVLTLRLPNLATLFGYGFALLNTSTGILNATTVTAFNGATNLGSVSFNAVPDPTFVGGFAGVQSVTAFDRLELIFNSADASAFAVDNLRFNNVGVNVVPEPSSLLLLGVGLGGIAFMGRRRGASRRLNA